MSKRKSGSVLSPESYKGVRTEPLCLLVFGRGNIQLCSFLRALSQALWSGKQWQPEQILFPMAFQLLLTRKYEQRLPLLAWRHNAPS